MSSKFEPTTPGSLTLESLEQTLGVLFVGYVFSMTLYGFTFFQSYMYFLRYPQDSSLVKTTVGLLCAMDTVIAGLLSHSLYHYLVNLFPYTQGLDFATDEFCAQIVLSTLVIYICQMTYAYKIYTSIRNSIVPSIVAILSTIGCVLGLVINGKLISNRAFVDLDQTLPKAINSAAQATVAASALITLITLTVALHPSRGSHIKPFPTWWDVGVAHVVSRGGAATVIQLGYFVVFLAAPSHVYWMPFHLTATKLFIVGVLTMLNSRESVQGGNISSTTSQTKPNGTIVSTHGVRSDLRFNVVDTNPGTINIEVSRTVQSDGPKAPIYYDDDFHPLDQQIGNKKMRGEYSI